MRIVFFNSCKTWGGGEKWHFEMAAALNQKQIEVFAVGSPNSPFSTKIQNEKIPLFPIDISGTSFLNSIKVRKLVKHFKSITPDVVIINLSADLKIAGIAAKKAGIKNIIYRRGSAIPIKNRFLNRYIFKNIVTNILANSEETKRTILANNINLFPKDKIDVIYNGIHLEPFENINSKEVEQPIILGNLARLSKQKGHIYLFNLAERLKNNNVNFKLIIGGDGELKDELKQIVKQKQLEKEVDFVGFVEDPKVFLESIDVFIFPSIWEGFGFSIVEAKLCKKPIIAFDISSNPEVIVDKQDGYLIKPFDEEAFFTQTMTLINDKSLIQKLGENGRKDAFERFSFTNSVSLFQEYITKL